MQQIDASVYRARMERIAQFEKWGQQNHPNFCLDQETSRIAGNEELASLYNIPTEATAKHECEYQFAQGLGTWFDILLEEVAEVLGSAGKDLAETREELIQTAAVALAWAEAIDRQMVANGEYVDTVDKS